MPRAQIIRFSYGINTNLSFFSQVFLMILFTNIFMTRNIIIWRCVRSRSQVLNSLTNCANVRLTLIDTGCRLCNFAAHECGLLVTPAHSKRVAHTQTVINIKHNVAICHLKIQAFYCMHRILSPPADVCDLDAVNLCFTFDKSSWKYQNLKE